MIWFYCIISFCLNTEKLLQFFFLNDQNCGKIYLVLIKMLLFWLAFLKKNPYKLRKMSFQISFLKYLQNQKILGPKIAPLILLW